MKTKQSLEGVFISRQTHERSDGVKSLDQHLPSILGKTTSVQQQLNGSPSGLVDQFALAVSSRVVGGRRTEKNAASGEVSPRLLTDKR